MDEALCVLKARVVVCLPYLYFTGKGGIQYTLRTLHVLRNLCELERWLLTLLRAPHLQPPDAGRGGIIAVS